MARIKVNGLAEYKLELSRLQDRRITEDICREVLKAGGEVVENAVRGEVAGLPRVSKEEARLKASAAYRKAWNTGSFSGEHLRSGITDEEYRALDSSLGVAPMQEKNSVYDVKVGFAGYSQLGRSRVANQLLARAINSGTSFRAKNPFLVRAERKAKKSALERMDQELEQQIRKRMSKIYHKL